MPEKIQPEKAYIEIDSDRYIKTGEIVLVGEPFIIPADLEMDDGTSKFIRVMTSMGSKKAKVLTYILEHMDNYKSLNITNAEMAKELGISRPTVISAMNILADSGIVKRKGTVIYVSTDLLKGNSFGHEAVHMPKIITFAALKGGVGTTMNLFNLAGVIAARGKEVLLIDVDSQCNLTANCGIDVADRGFATIKDIFSKYKNNEQPKAKDLIIRHPISGLKALDIIPSSILLFNAEEISGPLEGRAKILKHFVERNTDTLSRYDYILLDTGPSMNVFNINAFYVADAIILNTDVSSNSLLSTEMFCALWDAKRKQIDEMSEFCKEDNIEALLIGNCCVGSSLSKEMIDYIHTADFSKDIILDTVIPGSVQLKDTETEHKPINLLYKGDKAHLAYESLADELMSKEIL